MKLFVFFVGSSKKLFISIFREALAYFVLFVFPPSLQASFLLATSSYPQPTLLSSPFLPHSPPNSLLSFPLFTQPSSDQVSFAQFPGKARNSKPNEFIGCISNGQPVQI